MAYTEENVKLRRERAQQSTDSGAGENPGCSATQEGVFSNLDPKYKVQARRGG